MAGWLANAGAISLPNGSYTVHSVAVDAAGTIESSPDVTMRVDGQTSHVRPPVTRVTKPAVHAHLSGSTFLLASASSTLGVTNVKFRITGDGRTMFSGATPTLYGWLGGWNTRSAPNGTYTVSSIAIGNTGLVAASKGVVVAVKN